MEVVFFDTIFQNYRENEERKYCKYVYRNDIYFLTDSVVALIIELKNYISVFFP